MNLRVDKHPILGELKRSNKISFSFNGESYQAYEGDTIASALMAEGIKTLRRHEASNTPRGIYCNIGHCFECRVKVEKEKIVRACLTPVTDGMKVQSLEEMNEIV